MTRTARLMLAGVVLGAAVVCPAVVPRNAGCDRKLSDQTYACAQTLLDMRALQMAVEAYKVDHKAYPAARTLAELSTFLVPKYIAYIPKNDAWDGEFRYVASPDGTDYKLACAGSDGSFSEQTWSQPGLLGSSAEDAVLAPEPSREREWVIQE